MISAAQHHERGLQRIERLPLQVAVALRDRRSRPNSDRARGRLRLATALRTGPGSDGVRAEFLGELILDRRCRLDEAGLVDTVDHLDAELLEPFGRILLGCKALAGSTLETSSAAATPFFCAVSGLSQIWHSQMQLLLASCSVIRGDRRHLASACWRDRR